MDYISIAKYGVLTLMLAIASYTDIKKRIISNKLILVMLLAALLFLLVGFSITTVVVSFLGFAVAGVVFVATYFLSKGSLGAGDVKLAMSMALFVGLFDFINIMLYALIYTVIVGLGAMVIKHKKLSTHFPFAPFVLAGCITNIIYMMCI